MALRSSLQPQPHQYIGDFMGRPLDNGMVYFGEPDKDPEFYPINIYSDSDLSIPLSQPVRTKGGFMYNSGKMTEVYASQYAYSVKIVNNYGAVVFYEPRMERISIKDSIEINTKLDVAGSVTRTQGDKNSDYVSIKDFGVVGDGVADDTISLEKALQSGLGLDFSGCNIKITRPISATYLEGATVKWSASNTSISYVGEHIETIIRLSGAGVKYLIDADISIFGNKSANRGLDVLNDSTSMAASQLSSIIFDNIKISGIKRLKIFQGGDALLVRGGFSRVELRSGCVFEDVELPQGQGVAGSVGVSGVTVSHYGLTGYCKMVVFNGASISKVYSSDLTYFPDQDGLRYLVPKTANGDIAMSHMIIKGGSEFSNCYGRSIKTQCMFTSVKSTVFNRNEGHTRDYSGTEIDAQFGYLTTDDLTFNYSNGFGAESCINSATDTGVKVSGFDIGSAKVFTDDVTVLKVFASTYPRDGEIAPSSIKGVKIFGSVEIPIVYLVNGSKNKLTVTDTYVAKYKDTNHLGLDKTLVVVKTNGAITPYGAYVEANNNTTADTTTPAVVTDRVSGGSVSAVVSLTGNSGYLDNKSVHGIDAKHSYQVARIGLIGAKVDSIDSSATISGSYGVLGTFSVPASSTIKIPVRNKSGAMITVISATNAASFAQFYSFGTTNTVVSKGTSFEIGNTTEPPSGLFKIWSEVDDELTLKNTNTSSRVFTVYALNTY